MEIEKFHWKTDEAFNRIKSGRPVVLRECPIVYPHHVNWTMENLMSIIKDDYPCTVYVSPDKRYPYWDIGKNSYGYKFTPHFRKESLTIREFHQRVLLQKSLSPEEVRGYCYLNQTLVAEMGPRILEEYSKFSLQTAALYKVLAGWNEMMHNLLMIGQEGYTTPLHYDEVENIFTQLQGRKRVRLFPADCWPSLYPFPVGHPRDRQCQVTLPATPGSPYLSKESDRQRFPEFPSAAPHEMYADLEPGELLYIPQYWFHQMEALTDNISLSWWFKHTSRKDIDYKHIDLTKITFSAVRRNIEGVMAHMMGGGRKAHELFLAIASGRTRVPGITYKTAPSSSSSGSRRIGSGEGSNSGRSAAADVVSGEEGDDEVGNEAVCATAASPVDELETALEAATLSTVEHVESRAETGGVVAENSVVSLSLPPVPPTISPAAVGRPRLHYVAQDLIVPDTDAGALFLRSSDDDKWRSTVDQALSMLRTLFPPDVAAGFLLQVAVGRFSARDLQDY